MARGLAGLQGPFYGGTGCFHRRKVIYGLSPDNIEIGPRDSAYNTNAEMINGKSRKFLCSYIMIIFLELYRKRQLLIHTKITNFHFQLKIRQSNFCFSN